MVCANADGTQVKESASSLSSDGGVTQYNERLALSDDRLTRCTSNIWRSTAPRTALIAVKIR